MPPHLRDLKSPEAVKGSEKQGSFNQAKTVKVAKTVVGVLFGHEFILAALPFLKRFLEKNVEVKPQRSANGALPGIPGLPSLPGTTFPPSRVAQMGAGQTRSSTSSSRGGPNKFIWVLAASALLVGGYFVVGNDRNDGLDATTATTTEIKTPVATSTPLSPPATGEVIDGLKTRWRSIVAIEVSDGSEGWSGSGSLVIDGSYILTNFHVAPGSGPIYNVWFTNSFEEEPREVYVAMFVDGDEFNDLALLQIVDEAGLPVIIGGRTILKPSSIDPKLDPGENLTILGYPGVGGLTMTLAQGVYSGSTENENGQFLKTDGVVSAGVSGGAAFNSAGEFIGVPSQSRMDNEFNSAVGLLKPARFAAELIAKVKP